MKKILFLVYLCFSMAVFTNDCMAGNGGVSVNANYKNSTVTYSYGIVTGAQSGLSFPIGAKFYTGEGGGVAVSIEADYLWSIGSSLFGGVYYGYDYFVTGDNAGTGITLHGLKLVVAF
ncbi:MAG: hypothetical protein QME49_01730 [bacterium]|nr:hypothetical protein [bacterium]